MFIVYRVQVTMPGLESGLHRRPNFKSKSSDTELLSLIDYAIKVLLLSETITQYAVRHITDTNYSGNWP